MSEDQLEQLCGIVTESHSRIQRDFKDINPIVGVVKSMRKSGIPADAMTIDCSGSDKRIILILHDHQPEIISYQFSFKDEDPGDEFQNMQLKEFTADKLYDWIKQYFSKTAG